MEPETETRPGTLPLAYPFNWKDADDFSYQLDDEGVPLVFINKKAGLRVNPITVAQYGLHHLQLYSETQNEHSLRIAAQAVAWLKQNFQTWHGGIGAWVYDYDLDFYGPQAPWISGMAQGEGISLLLRMHEISGDESVLDIAQRAFQAFLNPVNAGGVVTHFPDGALGFEEYPTAPASLVLNGHIFALLGIHDYAIFFAERSAHDLFKSAVSGLLLNLKRYDTGFWNLYDLHPTRRLASPMYIKIHVQLLRILGTLTDEGDFDRYADKWEGYLNNPVSRLRWITGKLIEKGRLKF